MNSLISIDLDEFWTQSAYSKENYIGPKLDKELLRSVECELGQKLPSSYIELMRRQNGGIPKRRFHELKTTKWFESECIEIEGFYAIARTPECSLAGELSSKFWSEEWGYPDWGVYFADIRQGSHEMLCFDYRNSTGRDFEPSVVHIDQEANYRITKIASNFSSFLHGLKFEKDVL